MAKLSDEMKEAISLMSDKEKNKLLFRLIGKDKLLTEQLRFKLLENNEREVDRRAKEIEYYIYRELPQEGNRFLTPGYLLMDIRSINAKITHHVKVTKDKFSDVYLRIILLLEAFKRHHLMLENFPRNRSVTFVRYVVQRLKTIFKALPKLHEDYYLDIEKPLNELLSFVFNFQYTEKFATTEGIPRNWHY